MRIRIFKFHRLLLVALLMAATVMIGSISQASERKFRVSLHIPPTNPSAIVIKDMLDNITKESGGKLQFQIFYGGSLLEWSSALKGVGKGAADFALAAAIFTTDENPCWATVGLPGTGHDFWTLTSTAYDLYHTNEDIMAEFDSLNVVPTFGYISGSYLLGFRKPLDTLKGMGGLRCVAHGGSFTKLISNFGLLPVQIPSPEVYQSLDTGVVDAAWGALGIWYNFKWYEVVKQFYVPKYGNNISEVTLAVNKDVWNSFSAEDRKIIEKASLDATNKNAQLVIEKEKEYQDIIKKSGVNFYPFSQDQNDKFDLAVKATSDEWISKYEAKGKNVRSVFVQMKRLVAKYEKELEEKGYPWER